MAKDKPTEIVELVPALIAKRDFIIHQNDIHIEIKEGDDVTELPKEFLANLKTEQVI